MSTDVLPANDPLEDLVGRLGVNEDPRIDWRPSPGGYVARLLGLAVIVAIFIAAPHVAPDPRVNALAIAMVFGIIALSMNVLIGYTGQVSLGHAAFVGIGAFTSGFIITEMQLPWLAGVAGGIFSGILVALTLGGIALRLRGLYLALVTIAYGALAQSSLFQITAFTGGGGGRAAPRPGFASGDITYYYLCFVGLVIVWFLDWRLTATRPGRAIEALRDDERVAASWGISITGFKLLAFLISGAMAGFAGALFASIEQVVSPGSFEFAASLTFVLMTVVGGLRSRPGVVIGGFVFALLPVLLSEAERVWGHGDSINSLPPKTVQFVVGAGLAAGGVILLRHLGRSQNVVGLLSTGLMGALLVPLGVWVALRGAWISDFNIFGDFLTPLMEPVIGALLLIGTLTLFPGGIAEQNKELFRWLSFGPFHEKEPGAAPSGGGHG
jgi:branched-chain amino acid transport system permease protein